MSVSGGGVVSYVKTSGAGVSARLVSARLGECWYRRYDDDLSTTDEQELTTEVALNAVGTQLYPAME